ncbi:MAG: GGDEF domain-containing protein [Planctomycetota bacterium]
MKATNDWKPNSIVFQLSPVVMSTQTSSNHSPFPTNVPVAGDATIQKTNRESLGRGETSESCLVQIYPADIVDGMVLLDSDHLLIGRDEQADMVLSDSGVSRRHAELIRHEGVYAIEDLGSTNGTLVNGMPIDRQQILNTGDTVRIGSFIFRFLSADSVETQYHETVYNALVRDALTGTMNKRYLLESMHREIARAVRQRSPLSVALLDIDHFKSVNDTHGHLIGDEVLKEFGQRMTGISRDDDLLARYGGEEFCLLLAGTSLPEAIEITERCRAVVADRPFETSIGALSITASFGVACLEPVRTIDANDLLELADEKLYEAKRGGRNRVCG